MDCLRLLIATVGPTLALHPQSFIGHSRKAIGDRVRQASARAAYAFQDAVPFQMDRKKLSVSLLFASHAQLSKGGGKTSNNTSFRVCSTFT